jgi:hypothetical protein
MRAPRRSRLVPTWLMAPAAFHRIVYAGEDTPEFHTLGSRFLLAASIVRG